MKSIFFWGFIALGVLCIGTVIEGSIAGYWEASLFLLPFGLFSFLFAILAKTSDQIDF